MKVDKLLNFTPCAFLDGIFIITLLACITATVTLHFLFSLKRNSPTKYLFVKILLPYFSIKKEAKVLLKQIARGIIGLIIFAVTFFYIPAEYRIYKLSTIVLFFAIFIPKLFFLIPFKKKKDNYKSRIIKKHRRSFIYLNAKHKKNDKEVLRA